MTDKVQLIKKEIERRIKEGSSKNDISEGALALDLLLSFIDSLPEEPASEDLKEEIENYFSDWLIDLDESKTFCQIARHFAEWQKQKDMQDFLEKDCEWLLHNTMRELLMDSESTELVEDFIEDFKNYMKNE